MERAMEYLAEAIASSVERQCKVCRPHAVMVAYAVKWVEGILGWLQILNECRGVTRDDIAGFLRAFALEDDPVAIGAVVALLPE